MATPAAPPSIEAFLEQHLEAITDADPKTLTPYILALIHKPKKYCMEQLRDFLHEETEPFVEKLFDFLAKQTGGGHRKGREDRDRKRDRGDKEKDGKRRRHDDEDREAKKARKERGEGGRRGEKSAKAAKARRDDAAALRDPPPPYHVSEADARHGRGGTRGSAERGKGAEEEDFTVPLNPLENSLNSLLMSAAAPNPAMGDPNQRNVQLAMAQAPRGPIPGHPQLLQPGPAGPQQLHFPQGLMPLAPQAPHPMQFAPGFGPQFLGHPQLLQGQGLAPQGMTFNGLPLAMQPQQQHPGLIGVPLSQGLAQPLQRQFLPPQRREDLRPHHPQHQVHHTQHQNPRFNGGGGSGMGGGGGGEVPKNTVLVRNVPAEVNTIARLSAHFERFGMVLTVKVQPATRTALVTFRSSHEAYEALSCPEAVCGNRFISTELAHPAGLSGDVGTPERMVRHRRGSEPGPLRLAREEEGLEQSKLQRAEIERIKLLTQRRAETAEKLRQLEQKGRPAAAAGRGAAPTAGEAAPATPPAGPARNVLTSDRARQLGTLLEKKKATVEAALAKCKQRFVELERNPSAFPPAEKQTLLRSIRELGQALRGIAEQGRRLAPVSPLRRPSLGGGDGESRSGGTGHITPLPDMDAEDEEDDQATSDLFVRPFPAKWVDNEEDVMFHFATTTTTTPLSVEFHADYVKVVFPGKRTAMRALETSREWNDAPLDLHLTEPGEAGAAPAPDDAAPAAETGSAKGEDGAGDAAAPDAAEEQRPEADEDDDPDRSWKR